MRVFCPTCGSQNEGVPGAKVTCQACAAAFDVPKEATAPRSVAAPPAPAPFPAPVAQPRLAVQPPRRPAPAGAYNTAAIISLVCGLFFCIPFVTPTAAVITGFIAVNQINSGVGPQRGKAMAIAGIILGMGMLVLTALFVIGVMAK